ncbi:MAG: hypothetical protein ACTSR2_11035 [Candidatus Hodarchaeales archaeon]
MFSFNQKEREELLIGTVVFVLVEISSIITRLDLIQLLLLTILTSPLFFLHEIGHKIVAQNFGLKSKFRLDMNMVIISLISIIMPIKIIAPGVVFSYGYSTKSTTARIAMIGPLINIFLAGFFLTLSVLLRNEFLLLFLLTSKFSIDIALFNSIPLSVLDGAKIFDWNSALALLIFGLCIVFWFLHPLNSFF